MRQVIGIYSSSSPHWVGDGFPVRSMVSHATMGEHISPFLHLDYAGPEQFAPTATPRGVGSHPHRGFETVTIVYQGEVEHRDSTGSGGMIGPGDVQWMTAAAGILHEERHSKAFTEQGGTLEMAQLWVNLPAKDKSAPAAYQTVLDRDIPTVALPDEAGIVRVIAGNYAGHAGPARTFTPIDLWDLRLKQCGSVVFDLPDQHTTGLAILRGTITVNGNRSARDAQFVLLDRKGGSFEVTADSDATVLVLSGEPLEEPVAMRGPFVMNTNEELQDAFADFRTGKFGAIPA
ncbi:pirin family protein [Brucella cytisi]|uniref:pirin family protein n=1 Tax=Brucella cytisi TaxID=407152 RepID=UPI0035E1D40A